MELKNTSFSNNINLGTMSRSAAIVAKPFNNSEINRALKNSKATVELEGLHVSKANDSICRKLLNGEISDEEANKLILKSHGISL